MNRKFIGFISGYCPTQEDEQEIEIIHHEIHMAGKASPGHVKGDFKCDFAQYNDCPLEKSCPIYKEAPNDPYFL